MSDEPQPAPSLPFGDALHALLGYVPPRMQAMGRGALGAAEHAYNLPQRMIENAAQYQQTGDYNPAPTVDLMGMLAGRAPWAEAGSAGVFGGKSMVPGQQGVTLRPKPIDVFTSEFGNPNTHFFHIVSPKGKRVGELQGYTQYYDKNFHINKISSSLPGVEHPDIEGTPRTFGTGNMRSIIKALQDRFPDLETISGWRATGAREKAAKEAGHDVFDFGKTVIPLPKRKVSE